MFAELLQKDYSFSFGDADIRMRYDVGALAALEGAGLGFAEIFAEEIKAPALFRFFRAAVSADIDDERLRNIFGAIGGKAVWEHCRAAMTEAFPAPDPNEIPPPSDGKPFDIRQLRCCICDVMGKSEEFFLSSTPRELFERWRLYAAFNGAPEPERIKRYDDEE